MLLDYQIGHVDIRSPYELVLLAVEDVVDDRHYQKRQKRGVYQTSDTYQSQRLHHVRSGAEWDLDESDPAKKGVRIALELDGYPCGPHEDPDSPGATIRMVACPLESVLEAFSETLELDCSVSGDGVALFHRDDPRHAGWSFALYAGLDALMSPQDEPVESVSDDDSWSKEVFPAFTGSSDPFSDSSDFDGSLKSFLGDCARMGWPSGSFLWTLPGRRAFAVFDASRHLDKLENRIGPSGAFPRLRPLFRLDTKPERPGRLSGGAAADAGAEEDSPEQRLKVAWAFGIAVDEKRRTEADLRCEFLRRAESAGWKLRDGAIERAAESARRARTERTNGDLDYFALKAIVAAWPETNRTEFARSVPEWRNEEWLCFARAAEDWKWLVFLLDSDVSPERKWLPFCTDGFPGSGLVRAVLAESVLEADTNQFSHLELDFGFLSGEADETAEPAAAETAEADEGFTVREHRAVEFRLVEFACGVHKEADGEFQSLGFVDAHNMHTVGGVRLHA